MLAGDLELAALRIGLQTRAADVARSVLATTAPEPGAWALNRNAEAFADRTVLPTLAAAGLGFLVGGTGTAGAILRPDYATPVGLTAPLETLHDVRIALRHGAVIRSDQAMRRFAACSWVVLDDHDALREADTELAELRLGPIPENQLLPAPAAAGVWLGDPRGAALVRACRSRGLIARRAGLREIEANCVAIDYGRHVLKLRGAVDRSGLSPLRVEVDGVDVAGLRFRRAAHLAATVSVRRLQRAGMRVLLASEQPPDAVAPLAQRLGVDRYLGAMDAGFRRNLLRALARRRIRTVHAHLGTPPIELDQEHVSIALDGADGIDRHDADIVLFGTSIEALPALAVLARESAARTTRVRRMAMAPNLACVAGAFAFGLTGLAVVVISNLGTSLVYNRTRRALQSVSLSETWIPEGNRSVLDDAVTDDGSTLESDIPQIREYA